jgi:4-amino-4-deoxy-L-arabinose transferase-like glycosyltransferase
VGLNRRLALPAVLGVAGANFLWQLGSSSYFVDEIQSIAVARSPIGGVLHAISKIELTPPAYFYFQHEWLYRTRTAEEWVARLPSAVCGVVLVAAVFWLASLLSERRAVALWAASLTAVSPFVLEYAQLAQGYVFVMLAVTVAVAASLRAHRESGGRRPWLAIGAGTAVIALWLHYTAGLVVAPLCVWVATRDAFSERLRYAFVGCCVIAALALVPLILAQHRSIPVRAATLTAGVSSTNVGRVFATPLDGRADALLVLGVAVTVAAMVTVVAGRRTIVRERRLLVAIAVGVPVALLTLSAFGAHLMLTRYAAVAAPFTIVAIAAAVVDTRPRPLGALLAAGAVTVAVAGVLASHRRQGFYVDARGMARYIRAHELPGDAVLASSSPGSAVPLIFYGLRPDFIGSQPATTLVRQRHRRLWAISELPADAPAAEVLSFARDVMRPLGYEAKRVRVFPGVAPFAVVLEVPLPLRAAR